MNKKNGLLIILILFIGLLFVGGTFAYLTVNVNVVNNIAGGKTDCFLIDYSATEITGTLWPRLGPSNGLSNNFSMKINDSCNVCGIGTLTIMIDNTTASKYFSPVAAHCEDNVLMTKNDYKTSSECTSNGFTWVSDGTALKYAIYDNSSLSGTPVTVGYIKSASDIVALNNIKINKTLKKYYLSIWLDGYFADNDYTNLPFSGRLHASAVQDSSGSC